MGPGDPAETDLVTLPSAHGATATVERLRALLAQKGIEVFAHIDHAAGARTVGLTLRPTQLLIFGNPKAGTPLMQSRQTIGLDLPLRALVWEDGEGKAWLTYRRVADLARQHRVTDRDEAVQALDDGLPKSRAALRLGAPANAGARLRPPQNQTVNSATGLRVSWFMPCITDGTPRPPTGPLPHGRARPGRRPGP